MRTKPCMDALTSGDETRSMNDGPCAGGVDGSLKDGHFDAEAWYVVELRNRFTELKARDFLNRSRGFKDERTGEIYCAEAYAAVKQRKRASEVVIHGKLFVRVGQKHRIDLLRQCPYLKRYMTDRARSAAVTGHADFVRVPDRQIETLREILTLADGMVEYSELERPRISDTIRLTDGILSKSKFLRDATGTIEAVGGRNTVTVLLDKIGCFKFVVPTSDVGKIWN